MAESSFSSGALGTSDKESLKKARSLATTRRWKALSAAKGTVWGLCRSSGASYYKVALRTDDGHYYCACPSRKKPCKHALALSMLLADQSEAFVQMGSEEDWVAERLERDYQGGATEQEKQQVRNQQFEKRLRQMSAGLEELENWLLDLMRQGLAAAHDQPESYWESIASAMVDAKLGRVARRIRTWPGLLDQRDWVGLLRAEIGELYLLIQAYRHWDQLPADLPDDVLAALGVQQRKEQLLTREGVEDEWLVAGVQQGEEDQLRFRRTWLHGRRSDHFALVIDFAWGNQTFDTDYRFGKLYPAEVVYYPSNYPQRALLKESEAPYPPMLQDLEEMEAFHTLEQAATARARALARQPWLENWPCLLQHIRLVVDENGSRLLSDREGKAVPVSASERQTKILHALSVAGPLRLYAEWDRSGINPLSVIEGGMLIAI